MQLSAYISKNSFEHLAQKIRTNWRSGLTVALISLPLSIALSIASGAGPLPGLISGIWGTIIGSMFIGSNYNIIGAAGALSTILFTATLTAPLGLGSAVLPLIALISGVIILCIWALKLDTYLYYIPSSVMHGFAAGVAILIAFSQLFDATGLSHIKRTGTLVGDITRFAHNAFAIDGATLLVFFVFLAGIILWKKNIKGIPAVIPATGVGIVFGYIEAQFLSLDLTSLADKFGTFKASIITPIASQDFLAIISQPNLLQPILSVAGIVALISVLETLITAKLGDKITHSHSSSSQELLGLSLSNLLSGACGGLPTTGVFIRTGANIHAGATHRTSGIIAGIVTGILALVVLPFFSYLPMAVIAAILVNTALGLLEVGTFQELWIHERKSFWIGVIVALVTIFHDAGLGVLIGVIVALLVFIHKISCGTCDVTWGFSEGTSLNIRGCTDLKFPDGNIVSATYSIAGNLGYLDAQTHASRIVELGTSGKIQLLIIRMRDVFSIDLDERQALADALQEVQENGVTVYMSSASPYVRSELVTISFFKNLADNGYFTEKTTQALAHAKRAV